MKMIKKYEKFSGGSVCIELYKNIKTSKELDIFLEKLNRFHNKE